ncbi:hypothetical protein AB6A40_007433 [Gnathostoma spinigerum]|uniref:Uncharacterized protein n=1 Tax=Gnathostoma spinigerum TaxID=75299 RepID=A0ABD6ERC6_9BILA
MFRLSSLASEKLWAATFVQNVQRLDRFIQTSTRNLCITWQFLFLETDIMQKFLTEIQRTIRTIRYSTKFIQQADAKTTDH